MSRPSAQDKVRALDLAQLKNVAGHLKIKFHPEAIETDLIRLINQQPVSVINAALAKVDEPSAPPIESNTEEQVLAAIAKIQQSKPEFKAVFDKEDNTVTFDYKGCQECCNLAIPLRIIKTKAEYVSHGRRTLRGLGKDGTYGNSYADTILMG